MKNKIVLILGVLLVVNAGYSGSRYCPAPNKDSGYVHNNPPLHLPNYSKNDPSGVWSGTWEDLNAVIENAKISCDKGSDGSVRGVSSVFLPATLNDMRKIINHDNRAGWRIFKWETVRKTDDVWLESVWNIFKANIVKYVNDRGAMVVYNTETGRIVSDERFGVKLLWERQTVNLSYLIKGIRLPPGRKKSTTDDMIVEFISCKIRDVDFVARNEDMKIKSIGVTIELDAHLNLYYMINNENIYNQNILTTAINVRLSKSQVSRISYSMLNVWSSLCQTQIKVQQSVVNINSNKFITRPAKSVEIDLSQFSDNMKYIENAWISLNSCIEESLSFEAPENKKQFSVCDIRGIIDRGREIEAEKERREKQFLEKMLKSLENLNDGILRLEAKLQALPIENISVKEMNLIKKRLWRPLCPHLRKSQELSTQVDEETAGIVQKTFSSLEQWITDDNAKFSY